MQLVYCIALICLLLSICKNLVKWLQIKRFFTSASTANPHLQEELQKAQEELENTRNASPTVGEYAKFVKIMRAEQRVKDAESKLWSAGNVTRIKVASVELILAYSLKAILSITLTYICYRYRYEPVLVFAEHVNLQPLQGLLSFPTGISNAISVPMWVFSCNAMCRYCAAQLVKKK